MTKEKEMIEMMKEKERIQMREVKGIKISRRI